VDGVGKLGIDSDCELGYEVACPKGSALAAEKSSQTWRAVAWPRKSGVSGVRPRRKKGGTAARRAAIPGCTEGDKPGSM